LTVEYLGPILFLVGWVVLNKWLLPRMGVQT